MTDKPKLPWPDLPGQPAWVAMPREHAEAFKNLVDLSRQMAWTESTLAIHVRNLAHGIWEEIFTVIK